MKTLDPERRRLAADHAHVADRAAGMYRTRLLGRDERAGAAALAVCHAAARWAPGAAAFETYAIRAALRAIHREATREARRRDRSPLLLDLDLDPDRVPSGEDAIGELVRRDLAATLLGHFGRLTPAQRRALSLYVGGLSWSDVAREMGLAHRQSVENLRCRAARTLRGAVDGGNHE